MTKKQLDQSAELYRAYRVNSQLGNILNKASAIARDALMAHFGRRKTLPITHEETICLHRTMETTAEDITFTNLDGEKVEAPAGSVIVLLDGDTLLLEKGKKIKIDEQFRKGYTTKDTTIKKIIID